MLKKANAKNASTAVRAALTSEVSACNRGRRRI